MIRRVVILWTCGTRREVLQRRWRRDPLTLLESIATPPRVLCSIGNSMIRWVDMFFFWLDVCSLFIFYVHFVSFILTGPLTMQDKIPILVTNYISIIISYIQKPVNRYMKSQYFFLLLNINNSHTFLYCVI